MTAPTANPIFCPRRTGLRSAHLLVSAASTQTLRRRTRPAVTAFLLAAAFLGFAAPAWGRTVSDMLDRPIALPDRPLRLVSLAPSLTETVFALGRGEWLVGVSDLCNYPPEARSKPRVGGIAAPDLERIVALRPDVVLLTAEGNARELVGRLEAVGVQAFAVTPSSYPAVLEAIRHVGEALSAPTVAERLVRNIRDRVAGLTAEYAGRPRPRVLFLIWADPLVAAGPGTFLGDLIQLAGGVNVTTSRVPYPRLGWEDVLAAAPEVILVASHRDEGETGLAATLQARWAAWRAVPAIAAGRIVGVSADLALRPGPRLPVGLATLARAVHPAGAAP